jgi:hypothetical protein
MELILFWALIVTSMISGASLVAMWRMIGDTNARLDMLAGGGEDAHTAIE